MSWNGGIGRIHLWQKRRGNGSMEVAKMLCGGKEGYRLAIGCRQWTSIYPGGKEKWRMGGHWPRRDWH
jgi:hypothetical protein